MRTITVAAVLALALSAAAADPVITSVTPNTGPVAGGTKVTIKGSGFSDNCPICSPPFADPHVWFEETEAVSVTFIDSETIEAVTPPHLPGTVTVRVNQYNFTPPAFFQNGFTFEGDPNEAFDPILFPIFTGPVQGAFGSEFRTVPRVSARSGSVALYGVDTTCTLIDPPIYPTFPFYVGEQDIELIPGCSEGVGRLFWVPKGQDTLAGSLRVADVTRQADSHGVEIPVVHRDDFVTGERIALLGVPIDPRYRLTLRVYSLARGNVLMNLQIGNELHQIIPLPPADMFAPTYAEFTDFPLLMELAPGQKTIRVTVQAPNGEPIWAFITVTNNVTQQITTITPN